jgi:hypothetical protein
MDYLADVLKAILEDKVLYLVFHPIIGAFQSIVPQHLA